MKGFLYVRPLLKPQDAISSYNFSRCPVHRYQVSRGREYTLPHF